MIESLGQRINFHDEGAIFQLSVEVSENGQGDQRNKNNEDFMYLDVDVYFAIEERFDIIATIFTNSRLFKVLLLQILSSTNKLEDLKLDKKNLLNT